MPDHPIAHVYPPPEGRAGLSSSFAPLYDQYPGAEYGPNSGRSWLLDKFAIALQEQRVKRGFEAAEKFGGRAGVTGDPIEMLPAIAQHVGSVEDAMKRLRGIEKYALSTTAGSGGGFFPSTAPPYLGEIFVQSARAKSVLPALLPTGTLPGIGMYVSTGRDDVSASAAFQSAEAGAGSATDPTGAIVSGPVGTVEGHVDVSQQFLDRSDPNALDIGLMGELGAALGEQVDLAIINGTGTAPQPLGLLNASGITANTAGTATQVTVLPALFKTISDVGTAAGSPADLVLAHPRRDAWLRNSHDATAVFSPPLPATLGLKVADVPAIPVTLSSTQDAILVLVTSQACSIFLSPPTISVMVDVLSGTLQARVQAIQYLAVVVRQPKAVGKITGAGLTTPSFS